jgi:pSer/pThr/pTyr-binding forkhead associated (FHA) protein
MGDFPDARGSFGRALYGGRAGHPAGEGEAQVDTGRYGQDRRSQGGSVEPSASRIRAASIGRDAANDITSPIPRCPPARTHEATPRGYRIVDLESGNGILHQGRRVDSLALYPGCEVEIGGAVLRFESNVAVPALVLIGGAPQRSYPLITEETVLGRAPGNPIAIPDPLVSSRHMKIVRRGEVYAATDLESENGTWVNGVKVTSRELKQGDQIQVGGFTFYFALDGVIPAPDSIKIIQPAQTPSTPPPPPPSASASSPAAKTPRPRRRAPAASSRPRLLLIAGGSGSCSSFSSW